MGASAVMAIFSYAAASEAADAAENERILAARESKRIGEANAATTELETAEEARRTARQDKETSARARAKAAASGTIGGSQQHVISEMLKEQGKELSWLKTSGKRKAELERKGGASQYKLGMAAADTAAAKGMQSKVKAAGNVYTSGKSAGWWGGAAKG